MDSIFLSILIPGPFPLPGPVVGKHLDDIIPIIVANLQPEKDPELRLKFFSLLSRLVLAAPTTLDSEHHFGEFAVIVARDMILPNCVWKAGRTASAIRATAISCMWALLQSGVLTKEKVCLWRKNEVAICDFKFLPSNIFSYIFQNLL